MKFEMANLRPRTAVVLIAVSTLVIVAGSTILAWTFDRRDFDSLGQALWWSLQTVTTVGYGDIVPRTDVARGLAIVEGVGGQLFLAVLVARLVSLYSKEPSN